MTNRAAIHADVEAISLVATPSATRKWSALTWEVCKPWGGAAPPEASLGGAPFSHYFACWPI